MVSAAVANAARVKNFDIITQVSLCSDGQDSMTRFMAQHAPSLFVPSCVAREFCDS
jgi:hypothetical protein